MSEEKDFFKTCFDIVAGLEVENESQAIAKEVVLDEIENLQQEKQELINWLESKNNITLTQHKTIEPVIKIQEVIDKIKEMN